MNINVRTIYLTVILVGLCIILIYMIVSNINSLILLNESAGIGDAIGGITAPLLGIISSVLLYLTLTRQTDSNEQQRLKNESDIIFMMINQLETELSSYYYVITNTKGQEKNILRYYGLEGLHRLGSDSEILIKGISEDKDLSFKDIFQSGPVIMIADTVNLINARIEMSNLTNDLKKLFSDKVKSFYQCKLNISFTALSEALLKYKRANDSQGQKIIELVNRYKCTS